VLSAALTAEAAVVAAPARLEAVWARPCVAVVGIAVTGSVYIAEGQTYPAWQAVLSPLPLFGSGLRGTDAGEMK